MFVPTIIQEKAVTPDGEFTPDWQSYFQQQQQNMQLALSEEGFAIPNVSSAATSVTPNAAGGELLQIQNSYGQQNGVQLGTLVFDPAEVNGGSSLHPNGQLKILLGDGTFHKITNT